MPSLLPRLHKFSGRTKEITPCRLGSKGRVSAPCLFQYLSEVVPKRGRAGDAKLVGSSLQELHPFAGLPVIFVQC